MVPLLPGRWLFSTSALAGLRSVWISPICSDSCEKYCVRARVRVPVCVCVEGCQLEMLQLSFSVKGPRHKSSSSGMDRNGAIRELPLNKHVELRELTSASPLQLPAVNDRWN